MPKGIAHPLILWYDKAVINESEAHRLKRMAAKGIFAAKGGFRRE